MSDSDSDSGRPVDYDDDNGTVSLADLVQPIRDKAEFGSLKKQIARIDASEKALASAIFGCIATIIEWNFVAPMPRTQKERIERKIAYEQASKDVSRWLPQVRQNRLVRSPSTLFVLSSHCVLGGYSQVPTQWASETEPHELIHRPRN